MLLVAASDRLVQGQERWCSVIKLIPLRIPAEYPTEEERLRDFNVNSIALILSLSPVHFPVHSPHLGSGLVKKSTAGKESTPISLLFELASSHMVPFSSTGKKSVPESVLTLRPWVQIPEIGVSFFYPLYFFYPP